MKPAREPAVQGPVCACCVVIPFILDVRLVDAPARVAQEEGYVDNMCTHELIVLHLLGILFLSFFFFLFLSVKFPVCPDVRKFRGYQSPVYPRKRPRNLACPLLLVGPRRKKTDRGQRSTFPSEPPQIAPLILAHKGLALP